MISDFLMKEKMKEKMKGKMKGFHNSEKDFFVLMPTFLIVEKNK